MEELYVLRELCATQDEKYKERIAQLEQECVTLRDQIDHLQSVVKESEDSKTKLNKKVAEKAQAQKQMRYRLLFNFNNITCKH
jgi:chromosome segregation ATPase